jgi:hypothetical protein
MRTLRLLLALTALSSAPLTLSAQLEQASCPTGASCFVAASPASPDPYSLEAIGSLANSSGLVPVQVRMSDVAGRFAHKWVQFGSGADAITFGYGAANFPLIDFGQIVVTGKNGADLVSAWHLFPFHITPAEYGDSGHTVGPPVYVTVDEAHKLITQQRRHRFVFPYIPLFHDCHTYACRLMSEAEGKSALPCYLWFKGHF